MNLHCKAGSGRAQLIKSVLAALERMAEEAGIDKLPILRASQIGNPSFVLLHGKHVPSKSGFTFAALLSQAFTRINTISYQSKTFKIQLPIVCEFQIISLIISSGQLKRPFPSFCDDKSSGHAFSFAAYSTYCSAV